MRNPLMWPWLFTPLALVLPPRSSSIQSSLLASALSFRRSGVLVLSGFLHPAVLTERFPRLRNSSGCPMGFRVPWFG